MENTALETVCVLIIYVAGLILGSLLSLLLLYIPFVTPITSIVLLIGSLVILIGGLFGITLTIIALRVLIRHLKKE